MGSLWLGYCSSSQIALGAKICVDSMKVVNLVTLFNLDRSSLTRKTFVGTIAYNVFEAVSNGGETCCIVVCLRMGDIFPATDSSFVRFILRLVGQRERRERSSLHFFSNDVIILPGYDLEYYSTRGSL